MEETQEEVRVGSGGSSKRSLVVAKTVCARSGIFAREPYPIQTVADLNMSWGRKGFESFAYSLSMNSEAFRLG
jgi:hypothetical protein